MSDMPDSNVLPATIAECHREIRRLRDAIDIAKKFFRDGITPRALKEAREYFKHHEGISHEEFMKRFVEGVPIDDGDVALCGQLRALSRNEHDDHSIAEDAVDAIARLHGKLARAETYARETMEENQRLVDQFSLWEPLVEAAMEVAEDHMEGGPDEDFTMALDELAHQARRVREAGEFPDVKKCDHIFEANPGLNDSMRRYCTKCGIVEPTVREAGEKEKRKE